MQFLLFQISLDSINEKRLFQVLGPSIFNAYTFNILLT
jgi:hypothetical protein